MIEPKTKRYAKFKEIWRKLSIKEQEYFFWEFGIGDDRSEDD